MSVGTLTALPTAPPTRVDRRVARAAMLFAPIAVLPLALIVAVIGWLGHLAHLPEPVTAALAVGALALGTRGLHLDGLADTADGLAASYDRERALAVMRRGDTGPAGAAALVLVLLVQVSALAALLVTPSGAVAAGVVVCLSRLALPALCARGIPAARPGGLGAAVAGSVGRGMGAAELLAGSGLTCVVSQVAGNPWWTGIVVAAGTIAVVAALAIRCVHRFGGITGDVLGASVEVAFLGLLVLLSAR